MSGSSLFLIYIFFVLIPGLVFVFFIIRKSILRKSIISRSLNMKLLAVRLVPYQPSGQQQGELNIQQVREKVAVMEQFYTHLYTVRDKWWRTIFYGRPVFALELTIPSIGEEISFYVAVPRRLVSSVEKVTHGVFPEAQVEEVKDYNIFNQEGETAVSEIVFTKNPYYPMKTYQKLEGDPLRGVTNVFTKLAKEGEGAALQIVALPASSQWRKKIKDRARSIYEGKEASDDPFFKAIHFLSDVFGHASTSQEKPKPEEPKKITPMQDEMVKTMEGKSGKILFEANIRLVASAGTKIRAESILQELEVTFSQFADPNSNSLIAERVKSRRFKDVIFNFSFRGYNPARKLILSTEEMTSIFHFPNVPIETPKLKVLRAREAAAPPNLSQEGILLGYNYFRGDKAEIRLPDEDRRRHLYIIGQTGVGKTVFMESMMVQDIKNGRGVCVIDPHGDFVEALLGNIPRERAEDVIVFNPGDISRPLGLNILEIDPDQPQQKSFVIDDFFKIIKMIYKDTPEAFGPIFEKFFKNTIMLLLDDYKNEIPTIAEISRVFADKAYRDLKLSRETNPEIVRFWRYEAEQMSGDWSLPNMSGYVTSKFAPFLINEYVRPIITQQKSAFNFREVMDNKKILLVNLSKGLIGDLNASLLGLVIVSKILVSAFSRVDIPQEERQDFYLYIDEFQNFTTDSIATILSEARKYKLNLIIAHQFIKQLQENIRNAVFGNVGSVVSFRIGVDDIETLKNKFEPVFGQQDLLNIDNANAYVNLLMRGQTVRPFNIRTVMPERGSKEVANLMKELSRLKYGRDREEVEAEYRGRQGMEEI